MDSLLKSIIENCKPYTGQGTVANYIPELSKAAANDLGVCVMTRDKTVYCAGDCQKQFTMQSVVKPMILLTALMDRGLDQVRALVGVEATGKPFDAFNYSDQALTGAHINPMVNAGAIALCTLIAGKDYAERFDRLLALTRTVAGNPQLQVDEAVYLSEKQTGSKNRALAYMLKAYGMIEGDVEQLLECYFRACSIKVSSMDLARIAWVLANKGKDPQTGEQLFHPDYARQVNAILTTCGMYDGSGEFALNVGVPAKSGVGGGIMAVVPGHMGIGIYGPALDSKGNSFAGVKVLEQLSAELDLSIF